MVHCREDEVTCDAGSFLLGALFSALCTASRSGQRRKTVSLLCRYV